MAEEPTSTLRYRQYVTDPSIPVPRTTDWRYRPQSNDAIGSYELGQDADLGGILLLPTIIPSLTVASSDVAPNPSLSPSPLDSSPSPSPPPSPLDPSPLPSPSPPPSPLDPSPLPSPSPPPSPLDPSPPPSPLFTLPQSLLDPPSGQQDSSQLFSPLYPNAEITLCGALCAIMQFSTTNKLSYTTTGELLKLLAILLPSENKLPTSFYLFKKFFGQFNPVHDHMVICLNCKGSNCSCEYPQNKAHLVHLNITKQLEKILSDNLNSLQLMGDTCDEDLRDVWDGEALRPLCAAGRFFSDRFSLALSLSTDGVPLFKSSSISLWPVYLVILNLPPKIRVNAENIVLCAVWIGPRKPLMDLLLDPVCCYLERLSTAGITLGSVHVTAKLVMGVFDLPAKAAVLCCKQFNGEFGCSICLHPGKRLPNNSRVYSPTVYEERTHSQIVSAAIDAERTSTFVQGIIGISPFASIFDLVVSIPVDYMHAVCEGVTRWLMKAWFDPKFHKSPFYIGRSVAEIDAQLLNQHPPREFSRPPRSISKHLHYWKASELRTWLLVYSLPLLLGFLPSMYWHHYALLVCAMHMLLSDRISQAKIDAAEQMLMDFYILLPQLYGESSCTANAHLLSHLTKYVRLWGPLWTHSAFGFESKNGQLRRLFHGNSEIDIVHQLLFNVDISCTLVQVQKQLQEVESEKTLMYLNLCHGSGFVPRASMMCIGTNTYILGNCKSVTPTPEQSAAIGITSTDVTLEAFSRMYKEGVIYHSSSYLRSGVRKRDDTYCRFYNFNSNSICLGQIELFTTTPPLAFVRQLSPCNTSLINKAGHPCRPALEPYQTADLLSLYIIPVNSNRQQCQLLAVPVDCILAKVAMVMVFHNNYCVLQPNNVEHN